RRSGRYADAVTTLEPLFANVPGACDQMCRCAFPARYFDQAIRIRTVLSTHDQDQVCLVRERLHCCLTILRRIANIRTYRGDDQRESLLQPIDNRLRVVET